MKNFRRIWAIVMIVLSLITVFARGLLISMFGLPETSGQMIMVAVGITLIAIGLAPMFMFRRR